jgi:hypothetical protein
MEPRPDESNQDRQGRDDPLAHVPPVVWKVGRGLVRVAMLVFGLVWLGGIGTFGGFIAPLAVQQFRKEFLYRPATAVVRKYTPPERYLDEDQEPQTRPGVIEYTFEVDGRRFKGTFAQSRTDGEAARGSGRGLSASRKAGEELTAFYDPQDPRRNALVPGGSPLILAAVIFLLPFVAAGFVPILGAITGRMPVALRGTAGGRGMALSVSGGTYAKTFIGVSFAGAFLFAALAVMAPSRVGWIAGLVIFLAAIPLLTWRMGRRFVRRRAGELATERKRRGGSKWMTGRKAVIFLVGFTVFWCGVTGVVAAFTVGSLLRHADAQNRFHRTTGVVLASRIDAHAGDESTSYSPRITYQYTVAGTTYKSGQYAYGVGGSSDRSYAAGIIKPLPKGARVPVYYDPDNPAEAVLRLEAPGLVYFALLFLQPFLTGGVAMVPLTICSIRALIRRRRFLEEPMRRPWRIPRWGVLQNTPEGLCIRKRRNPLLVFALGYGLTCFVALFPIGFGGRVQNATPQLVGIVLCVAAGVGLVATAVRVLRPRDRLVLDRHRGRLLLGPPGQERTLPFEQIDCWQTGGAPDPRSSQGGAVPRLWVVTTEGHELPVHTFVPTVGFSDQYGWRVCEKVAAAFGELTGKPARKRPSASEQSPPPPKAVRTIFSLLRRIIPGGQTDRETE